MWNEREVFLLGNNLVIKNSYIWGRHGKFTYAAFNSSMQRKKERIKLVK
jgi:hypothetical protein